MGIIEQLERTKSETLNHFDLPDEDLRKSYGRGKWSIRYVLNHLADSETVLFYRIRRVISEPKQVIWAYDQDAWARQLDYATVPLELAKRLTRSRGMGSSTTRPSTITTARTSHSCIAKRARGR